MELIRECSINQHEHIKKAVSWALREIGKINYVYNEKAVILANELKETGNKTQMWIAKDVLKEIESVVKPQGRKRFISVNTEMGQKVSRMIENKNRANRNSEKALQALE